MCPKWRKKCHLNPTVTTPAAQDVGIAKSVYSKKQILVNVSRAKYRDLSAANRFTLIQFAEAG